MAARKILVIVGTTRDHRYSEKAARWFFDKIAADPRFESELVDLRDWPLPFFDQPRSPARVTDGNYGNDVANQWAQKVASADGYVMVTSEYNHGYPAVLKNALDWIYREWNKKPVTFVSYGNAGGARAIEQLRQVAVELDMAPLRRAVHIPGDLMMATNKDAAPLDPAQFARLDAGVKLMLDELAWWAEALAAARAKA